MECRPTNTNLFRCLAFWLTIILSNNKEKTTMKQYQIQILVLISILLLYSTVAITNTNYNDVLVIINNNSPISDSVGTYFASIRNVPSVNIIRVNASCAEEIDSLEFNSIRTQIENYILQNNLLDTINYIVTTKGMPLKINRGNTFSTSSPSSSLESELTLILSSLSGKIGNNGFTLSPYFLSTEPFSRSVYGIYLVTRLDGYNLTQIKNLIDKAAGPIYVDSTYSFVLDQDPTWNSSLPFLNNSMSTAHNKVIAKGYKSTLETSTLYLTEQSKVMGYTSWGSNDRNSHLYTQHARPQNTWTPGSIAETYVSTSGRTFSDPVVYGQSVIADLLSEGITGVKGYVFEPYSNAMAIVWVLFDRYTDGFNMAESFYSASRALSWMDVVIGDPKMKVYTAQQPTLPVQLSSFTGIILTTNSVKLEWSTISEINNYGFFIQKFDYTSQSFITIENSFQAGAGHTLIPQYYSWIDEEATGNEIQYRLKQIDNDGLEHYHGPITVLKNPTNVKDTSVNPKDYAVLRNYPNPFNPSTEIQFNLEHKEKVSLKIFNSLGQEVAVLADQQLEAGSHKINFTANSLPSGIYYAALQTDTKNQVTKMALLK